jgi:N4-gp56 family major capsid protein
MSITQFSSSSAETVKRWSERALYDFQSDTELVGQMIKDGVLTKKDDLSRGAGDSVTVSWLSRLTDQGLIGMETANGVESALAYASDALLINQIRIPVIVPASKTIDAQRVNFNLNEDSYRVMSEWMKVRGTLGALNQLAGNNASTINYDGEAYSGSKKLIITGCNAAVAPSTTSGVVRILRPNALTTDQAVAADTTATMKLSQILDAETYAMTSRPYIRPLSETGGHKFVLYVHTEQYNQLLNDTTSPYQYRDLQQAMIASGRGEGEIKRSFVFSQTLVRETDKVPLGVNSSTGVEEANCRRAVFCGKDAGAIGFGQGFTDSKGSVPGFMIRQESADIGNLEKYAMSGIFGIKKLQFDGNDNGSIVISTYSAL